MLIKAFKRDKLRLQPVRFSKEFLNSHLDCVNIATSIYELKEYVSLLMDEVFKNKEPELNLEEHEDVRLFEEEKVSRVRLSNLGEPLEIEERK